MPLVHFFQAFTEAAFRHDHFNAVREVALTGSRAAFVASHLRTPGARTEAMVTGSTIMTEIIMSPESIDASANRILNSVERWMADARVGACAEVSKDPLETCSPVLRGLLPRLKAWLATHLRIVSSPARLPFSGNSRGSLGQRK